MVRKTLKSQIAAASEANPTFDPLQISDVLKGGGVIASPAYCEQIMREYNEKKAKAGITSKTANELTFDKVVDDPEKAKKVEEAKKSAETEKNEKEAPKELKTGIKEPSKEEIEKLEKTTKLKPPELMQSILSGQSKPILEAIFNLENWVVQKMLDEQAFDDKALNLLINTWTPLCDTWLAKLADEHKELYVALITTAVMHIPLLLKIADKYLTKGKEKKKAA